jgi:hypothetical protein
LFVLYNRVYVHKIIRMLFGITGSKELRQFHTRSGITHQS